MKRETVHKKTLMNFNPMGETLTASIRLALPPIAICFTDKVSRAATEVFATSPSDRDLCAIGTFAHDLEATEAHDKDRRDALKVFADLGYVREQDIASIAVPEFRPSHVVYGPLATMPLAPDVVMLLEKVKQILMLSEASPQVEGGLPPAMGGPACAIVPAGIQYRTGGPALRLLWRTRLSGRADRRGGAVGDSWCQAGSLRETYRSARRSKRRSDNLPPGAPRRRGGWQ